jgi:hypothetical protein
MLFDMLDWRHLLFSSLEPAFFFFIRNRFVQHPFQLCHFHAGSAAHV